MGPRLPTRSPARGAGVCPEASAEPRAARVAAGAAGKGLRRSRCGRPRPLQGPRPFSCWNRANTGLPFQRWPGGTRSAQGERRPNAPGSDHGAGEPAGGKAGPEGPVSGRAPGVTSGRGFQSLGTRSCCSFQSLWKFSVVFTLGILRVCLTPTSKCFDPLIPRVQGPPRPIKPPLLPAGSSSPQALRLPPPHPRPHRLQRGPAWPHPNTLLREAPTCQGVRAWPAPGSSVPPGPCQDPVIGDTGVLRYSSVLSPSDAAQSVPDTVYPVLLPLGGSEGAGMWGHKASGRLAEPPPPSPAQAPAEL